MVIRDIQIILENYLFGGVFGDLHYLHNITS